MFRVYDHGEDFQIIGKDFERWVSTWQANPQASLQRAIDLIPQVNHSQVIYTGE
jgi:hypothetical protein